MKMIKINNNIQDRPADLYSPDGQLIGTIENLLAFYDVRLQIKKEQVFGYYLMFEGQKIKIDKNGELENYPDNLFDTSLKYLTELI